MLTIFGGINWPCWHAATPPDRVRWLTPPGVRHAATPPDRGGWLAPQEVLGAGSALLVPSCCLGLVTAGLSEERLAEEVLLGLPPAKERRSFLKTFVG